MRKALIVGIDHHDEPSLQLFGAVNDARSVADVLERHADETLNFAQPLVMTAEDAASRVTRKDLRDAARELFDDDEADIALFYFSGHGYIDSGGGYICGSDSTDGSDGLALSELVTFASKSRAKNKVIILDCCHSGIAGDDPKSDQIAEIKDGMTILTASTAKQYAMEQNGSGVFTSLFVDALNGAAANLVGDVTPGSVYAHIDQSLGNWEQRPVFKTNIKKFVSLRKCHAPIELADLQKLTSLFEFSDTNLALDPSYEPERPDLEPPSEPSTPIPPPDERKTADFAVLQNLAKVNLVRPVGAPHMWHAAMDYKACELTVLGRHYWTLVKRKLI